MKHLKKIQEKLSEMQESTPVLRKHFNFSLEKLQDNPEECLGEIENYLEQHSERIEDFSFESYIDEETFAPVLIMKVTPVAPIRNSMTSFDFVGRLFTPQSVASAIRENLEKIFANYLFEMNDKETRLHMSKDMEKALIFRDYYPTLSDITTSRDIDAGSFKFIVNLNDNEMTIGEYLEMISERTK
jgi:hypothetical protein